MHDHYTYRVTWSGKDRMRIGTCIEFPSLSWLANTPGAALTGIRRIVAETLDDMRKFGEKIPEPLMKKNYSWRFVVRVPPEVHRKLALHAVEQGVSLNRLISSKLSA